MRSLRKKGRLAEAAAHVAEPLPPREPTPAEVRACAVAQGLPVPAKGRVPRSVRAAYDEVMG